MHHEDYLVTTWLGKRSWRRIWNSATDLALDHPEHWFLERTDGQVYLRDSRAGSAKSKSRIPEEFLTGKRFPIKSPTDGANDRKVIVQIQALQPILPPYHSARRKLQTNKPGQIFLYSGMRYLLTSFQSLGSRFYAYADDQPVFKLSGENRMYRITALNKGVVIRFKNEPRQALQPGGSYLLNEQQMSEVRFIWKQYWWRTQSIPTNEPLPIDKLTKAEARSEHFFKILTLVGVVCIALILYWLSVQEGKPKSVVVGKTQISLKKPESVSVPPESSVSATSSSSSSASSHSTSGVADSRENGSGATPGSPNVGNAIHSKTKSSGNKNKTSKPSTPQSDPKLGFRNPKLAGIKPIDPQKPSKPRKKISASSKQDNPDRLDPDKTHHGATMMGSGNVPQNEIDKALAKHLSEFQECYDQAIQKHAVKAEHIESSLGDPYLGRFPIGPELIFTVGWTLRPDGKITDFKTRDLDRYLTEDADRSLEAIEDQMAKKEMAAEIQKQRNQRQEVMDCVVKEISKINFPPPSGGDVTVAYPFSFTSFVE